MFNASQQLQMDMVSLISFIVLFYVTNSAKVVHIDNSILIIRKKENMNLYIKQQFRLKLISWCLGGSKSKRSFDACMLISVNFLEEDRDHIIAICK